MIGITVVFGDEFLKLFCDVTLKSLSTNNNLCQPNCDVSEWIINTTEDGKRTICNTSYFQKIQQNTKIVFVNITKNTSLYDKYSLMSEGHNLALKKGVEKKEGVFFIQPDAIYFDGIIKYIKSKNKFAGVFVPSFMVIREKFYDLFSKPESCTSLKNICDASCQSLHQFTLDHDLDSSTFRNDCPNFIMSKISNKDYIFQPMPHGLIYLNPNLLYKKTITSTYDSDLLENFEKNIESAFFENNARNCIWPEMSPRARFSQRVSNEPINFCWILHAWRTEKHFGNINIQRKFLSLSFRLFSNEIPNQTNVSILRLKIISLFVYTALRFKLFLKVANISKTPDNRWRRCINLLFRTLLCVKPN